MQVVTIKRETALSRIANKRKIAYFVDKAGTLFVWCNGHYEDVYTLEELNRICKGANDNG